MQQNAAKANRIARLQSLVLAFIAAALVAGCGGGNGSLATNSSGSSTGTGTTGTGTTTTTALASSLQLLTGSPTIPSDGGTSVLLTAVVLDTNNNELTNQPITFQVIDPVVNPAFISATTGTGTGTSTTSNPGAATATLSLGANKTDRTITITASVIPAVGQTPIISSVQVMVTGTTIAISGQNSLVFGATLPLTAVIKDAGGNPIAGQTLLISSQSGNKVTPASAVSDGSGSVSFVVTGTAGGPDIISVSGAGAVGTTSITVNSANFVFLTPSTNALVPINTQQVIQLHWDNAGVAQVGQPVLFSSTRGTLSATTVTTDSNGNAATSVNSAGTGQSTITAAGPGGTPAASLNVVFTTVTANKVSVQAGQSSVPINTFINGVAQTTNRTPIIAVVRDVNNNLVQGATVNFQIVTDPSGGQLDSPAAVTNISGSASVNYIAGTTSSGNNTVLISATVVSVNGVPASSLIQATVNLSVTGQSLFIRMQTDNLVSPGTGIYTKSYFALVTDSAGNPVPNTTVVFSAKPANIMAYAPGTTQCEPAGSPCPGAYEKGQWISCPAIAGPCTTVGWQKVGPPYYDCLNEDTNFNGILDPGEDFNGNGKLDPGNVAGVNNTSITDANGIATANVVYVKAFASWSAITLTATITVAGTEFIQNIPFVLPIALSDISVASTPPPGQTSPFGTNTCNMPN